MNHHLGDLSVDEIATIENMRRWKRYEDELNVRSSTLLGLASDLVFSGDITQSTIATKSVIMGIGFIPAHHIYDFVTESRIRAQELCKSWMDKPVMI